MTAVIGRDAGAEVPLPADPLVLAFHLGGAGAQAGVRIHGQNRPVGWSEDEDANRLLLFVTHDAWRRLGGAEPTERDTSGYHVPSELRAIALALRDCALTGAPRDVYRLAKSIELLCETIRLRTADLLVPLGRLAFDDTRRLLAARRMIDERWQEKLTLQTIARSCGLNRDKLTRGFRELFNCTIAEALAERRLRQASRMLLTTDKPVSSIGYENGYLNNASFARAFSRRFGVSPSDYRSFGVAS